MMNNVILEVRRAKKYFAQKEGLFSSKSHRYVKAVDDVSLSIKENKIFGLVGESGCGKTTIGKLILMLEKLSSGNILFKGKDIYCFSKMELAEYRASIQTMFQDPYSSLNPRMKVRSIISEPILERHRLSERDIKSKVDQLLSMVGLQSEASMRYPHQFSGGQRQRIALARALSLMPSLLILDEPVSALDVSIRAQMMNLLMDIHDEFKIAFILIAHDLAVIKYMCDTVGVMYVGKLVEYAGKTELYQQPLHPYTNVLLSSILIPDPRAKIHTIDIRGEVPNPINPPLGCRFHPRCYKRMPKCSEIEPEMKEAAPGHLVACHIYH